MYNITARVVGSFGNVTRRSRLMALCSVSFFPSFRTTSTDEWWATCAISCLGRSYDVAARCSKSARTFVASILLWSAACLCGIWTIAAVIYIVSSKYVLHHQHQQQWCVMTVILSSTHVTGIALTCIDSKTKEMPKTTKCTVTSLLPYIITEWTTELILTAMSVLREALQANFLRCEHCHVIRFLWIFCVYMYPS